MFGCAIVDTVPAVVANGTVPVTLAPAIADSPAPLPLTFAAIRAADNVMLMALMFPLPDVAFANM